MGVGGRVKVEICIFRCIFAIWPYTSMLITVSGLHM